MPVRLALLILSLSFPTATAGSKVSAQLAARLAAIRGAGDPVTMLELAKACPDPREGQNAADVLNVAFQRMAAIKSRADVHPDLPIIGKAELPEPNEGIPLRMRRAIRACLKEHTEVLELLHQAATIEGCKFRLDFTKGPALELPHLKKLRQAARLLALETIDRTESGKVDEAAGSLVALLRLGSALKDEPILLSGLVRMAVDLTATRQIERWTGRGRPSRPALKRVEAALRGEADPNFLANVLVGDRCLGIDVYQNRIFKGPEIIRKMPRAKLEADMMAYLDVMNAYVAAARKPYPQSFVLGARFGGRLKKRVPQQCVFARMLLPQLAEAFCAGQEHMARLASARTALAVLRYRARHKKLPDGLAALVPNFIDAVPPDSFAGKPLLYRKSKDGFVIYAVGENGKDDGGSSQEEKGKMLDIGFRVRWPRAKPGTKSPRHQDIRETDGRR